MSWYKVQGWAYQDITTFYITSGGSTIFERGVQADYGSSTDCFTMAGEYVNVEGVNLVPILAKCRKFSEFRTFEIASAGFSMARHP